MCGEGISLDVRLASTQHSMLRSRSMERTHDRFAFHDYNRLAAEDERDVGDSTDIDGSDDWIVTDDDEGDDDVLGRLGQDGIATAEAPF